MTSAAAAARVADALQDRPGWAGGVGAALAVVVLGGLIEGTAIGTAQAAGLGSWLTGRRRAGWVVVTVVVAGLGWAGASAPAVLSADDGQPPPLALVLLGAVGLGLGMGALLGVAQAPVFRPAVSHPWRWLLPSSVGWALAMPVIFLGATLPDAGWPTGVVVATGAVTGLAAGAMLGLVTGVLVPTLGKASLVNRVVLALLGSPSHRLLDRSVVGLRLRGTVSGRLLVLPVSYATDEAGLVVVPGRPERKTWWRNLRAPAPMAVLVAGTWREATGSVVQPDDPAYPQLVRDYRQRWPRARPASIGPVVRIALDTPDV
jgi:hypothetical protein